MGLIGVGTLWNSELGCNEIGITTREYQMRKLVGSDSGSESGSPGLTPLSDSWLE